MENSCDKNINLNDQIKLLNSPLLKKKITLHRISSIITLVSIILFMVLPVYIAYKPLYFYKNTLLYNGVYYLFYFLQPIIDFKLYYSVDIFIMMPSITLSLAYFIYLAVKIIRKIIIQNRLFKAIKTNDAYNFTPIINYQNDVTFLKVFFSISVFYFVQYYLIMFINIYAGLISIAILLVSEVFRLKAKRVKVDDTSFEEEPTKLHKNTAIKLSIYKLLSSILFFISLLLFIVLPLYNANKSSTYSDLKIANLYEIFSKELFVQTHITHKISTIIVLAFLIVISIQTALTLIASIINFLRIIFSNENINYKLKQSKFCLSLKTFSLLYLIICVRFFAYTDVSNFNVITHAIILCCVVIGEVFRRKSIKKVWFA